jgi:exodeoxyribonuclease V gamma subunit
VRWGLSADHRAELGFADVGELNSWHFGLRRMLLGYATGGAGESGDGVWQGVLPYDEVAGLTAAVLGPLKVFIDALAQTRREWAQPATPEAWTTRLRALLARFFAPTDEAERALLVQLGRMGDDWLAQCEQGGFDEPLPATVVREAWLARLDAPQLGRRFLSGGVSFCSLMPMRAIPFRMVCLLGMNDGDYPRQSVPAAFDLMQRDHRPGDRSRREDDRYLFLEAVLSARDALYVSWVGRDIRDNTEAAPSTLVGQLRDHVAAGWCLKTDDGVSDDDRSDDNGSGMILLEKITSDHPLQPFSNVYFDAPAEGAGDAPDGPPQAHAHVHAVDGDDFASGDDFAPLSPTSPGGEGTDSQAPRTLPFDPAALPPVFTFASEWAPAQVPSDWVAPGARQPALPEPEADHGPQRLELAQLARFLANPVAAFFAQRLNVQPAEAAEAVRDDEAFALDGLTQWGLQAALIEPLQHAVDQLGHGGGGLNLHEPAQLLQQLLQAQSLAGQLPLHGFGAVAQEKLALSLSRLMARHAQVAQAWPEPLAQVASLNAEHEGLAVQASLQGLRRAPDGSLAHIELLASRLHSGKAVKHHLLVRPWVRHLAWQLALGGPGGDARDAATGVRTLVVSESGTWSLAPLPLEDARAAWHALLAAWRQGMRAPLPVVCGTALAWLGRQDAGPQAALQAARQAYEGGFQYAGDVDRSPALARTFPRFEDLLREPDAFAGWARRLYGPMLRAGQPWTPPGAGALAGSLRAGMEGADDGRDDDGPFFDEAFDAQSGRGA